MLVHSFGTRVDLKHDYEAFGDSMGAETGDGAFRVVPNFDSPKLVLGWVDGDPKFTTEDVPWDPAFVAEAATATPLKAAGP